MTEGGRQGGDEARAAMLAALEFQVELGADEAIGEAPVDRFAESAAAVAAVAPRTAPAPEPRRAPTAPRTAGGAARAAPPQDAAQEAQEIAAACTTLEALHDAIRGFERSPLKKGARSTVIFDGTPGARVMIVGEAPGREEDRAGRPFVGKSGQLLDRMLAAIGLDRADPAPARSVYIANAVYWRPIENRRPSTQEVAMLLPFLTRHIELARPEFLLLMGAAPSQALLETELGITRLRGTWREWRGVPALATFHPAYLLREPAKKRESWRDLLSLRAALDGERIA